MKIINADVYCPDGEFRNQDIYIEGEKFAASPESGSEVEAVCGSAASQNDGEIIDAAGCYAIPGLVDIHFHGAM